jgi:hypothetical protein
VRLDALFHQPTCSTNPDWRGEPGELALYRRRLECLEFEPNMSFIQLV